MFSTISSLESVVAKYLERTLRRDSLSIMFKYPVTRMIIFEWRVSTRTVEWFSLKVLNIGPAIDFNNWKFVDAIGGVKKYKLIYIDLFLKYEGISFKIFLWWRMLTKLFASIPLLPNGSRRNDRFSSSETLTQTGLKNLWKSI